MMPRYSRSNDVFACEQLIHHQAQRFLSVQKPFECPNCGPHRGFRGQREGQVKRAWLGWKGWSGTYHCMQLCFIEWGGGAFLPLCKCHLLGASFLRQINTLETYRKACFPTAPIQSILSQCIIRKNHLLADVLPSSMVYGEYLHILWLAPRWPVVLRILEERLCLSAWFASLFEVDVYASTIEWCLKTDGDFWKMLSRTNLWNLWRRMQ